MKISVEILNKFKPKGFVSSCLSTYDLSTLYTTLPQNIIKQKLIQLIEQTFNREGSLYLVCNCDDLNYIFDCIFIRLFNYFNTS